MNIDTQIYTLARNNGFTDISARLIVAQARLESADYTSNVFKKNNNLFGMKFVGQKRATRGTLAPFSERSTPCKIDVTKCKNTDYYASYTIPLLSAEDLILRLYAITRNGITPTMLKNATTPEIFADLLKKRNYYGSPVNQYAAGIKSKLNKIKIITGTGLISGFTPFLLLAFFFIN